MVEKWKRWKFILVSLYLGSNTYIEVLNIINELLKDNIYDFTIVIMIYFIFTFRLINNIEEYYKLTLISYHIEKVLLLYDLELYKFKLERPPKIIVISKIKVKNLFIFFSS